MIKSGEYSIFYSLWQDYKGHRVADPALAPQKYHHCISNPRRGNILLKPRHTQKREGQHGIYSLNGNIKSQKNLKKLLLTEKMIFLKLEFCTWTKLPVMFLEMYKNLENTFKKKNTFYQPIFERTLLVTKGRNKKEKPINTRKQEMYHRRRWANKWC